MQLNETSLIKSFCFFVYCICCMNIDYIEYPKKGMFANF